MNILEKKETKIIAVIVMLLIVILTVVLMINQGNLKQTKHSLDHEVGHELVLTVRDYFDVDDETAKEITLDTSKVNTGEVGAYEVTASYKGKGYVIKINVVDTTAPKASLAVKYIFTNDAGNVDVSALFESVHDASECTTKLVRFERKGNLEAIDEKALNGLIDAINKHVTDDELRTVGTTDVPTEAGIYRGIIEIADTYGNASYEEICLILDTTGAEINEVADQVVTVKKDKLTALPELDKSLYKGLDNVDGILNADDFSYELVLRDEVKHEWLVKVSHTDRAGNTASADFLITVQEEKEQSTNKPSSDKNNASDKATSNKDNTSSDKNNTSDKNNSSSDKNNTGNNNSSNSGNSSTSKPSYDPADTNKDGWVSEEEGMGYITPEKQACIDAGYGVVCEFDDDETGGKWYGILMPNADYQINGKYGWEILGDYLDEHGLDGQMYGCWINTEKEWYWYIAENVHEREVDIEF